MTEMGGPIDLATPEQADELVELVDALASQTEFGTLVHELSVSDLPTVFRASVAEDVYITGPHGSVKVREYALSRAHAHDSSPRFEDISNSGRNVALGRYGKERGHVSLLLTNNPDDISDTERKLIAADGVLSLASIALKYVVKSSVMPFDYEDSFADYEIWRGWGGGTIIHGLTSSPDFNPEEVLKPNDRAGWLLAQESRLARLDLFTRDVEAVANQELTPSEEMEILLDAYHKREMELSPPANESLVIYDDSMIQGILDDKFAVIMDEREEQAGLVSGQEASGLLELLRSIS